MYILFVVIHVFVCIALILIVLLQTGKGAEMGAAFGGASQTIFGGAGPGAVFDQDHDRRCYRFYDNVSVACLYVSTAKQRARS